GGTVALSTNLGSLTGVTAVGDGSYTATLTSASTAGNATITGTLDGNAIIDSASVALTPGVASTATTTLTAAPNSITADGVSTSTITVQLKDANGNNLSANGGTVSLSTNLGSLTGVTAVGDGSYTATLTSATMAGTATITGTLDGNAINDDASVDFTSGVASTATTTLTASPNSITADGVSISTITVQLKDADGNNLTSDGGTVSLSTSLGSVSAVNGNGDGTYTAVLTSATTTGTATISGMLDGVAIVDTASVDFISLLDTDNDGIANNADLDDDNDGIPDSMEGDGLVDSDNDLIADSIDLDSDNDGLFDIDESGADDPRSLDLNNDGRIDNSNSVGVNGLADAVETSADSGTIGYNGGAILDSDSDKVRDFRDLDSDNDGIPDVTETGATDPDGDGVLGTGAPAVDANGLAGGAALIAADTDIDSLPDQRDLDADNDGIFDIIEAGGVDSISDGLVDGFVDNDGNGFDDGLSVMPLPVPDTDFDGIPDFQDNDDTDNDGIPDSLDLDDDNDGITDIMEGAGFVDSDTDGIADSLDLDSDNDGLSDLIESGAPNTGLLDADNDGRIDPGNTVGSNGVADVIETSADSAVVSYNNAAVIDTDADGMADFRDLDSDNDSVPDVVESGGDDPDGDGLPGSGTPAVNNAGLPAGGDLNPIDSDNDGQPNQRDLDSDGDGIYDLVEARGQDADQNGMVDNFVDNDADGFDDTMETLPLAIVDSDADGTPDLLDADTAAGAVIHTGVDGIGMVSPWLLLAPLLLVLRSLSPLRLAATIVLCSMALAASADESADQNNAFWKNIYIGAGLGYSIMAPETGGTIYSIEDDTDTAGKLFFGIDLSDRISAELSYNDLGTTRLNPNGEIDYTVTALYGLYYLFDHGEDDHVGPAIYLKAGLGSISNSANVAYQRDNSIQLSFGVGVEYGWENGLAVRAVAETFDDDASLITTGLLYRFGKRTTPAPKSVVQVIAVDTDNDGVVDSSDQCPGTAAGTAVDQTGCEPDGDKDGVVDRDDQCPATVAGAAVNDSGCALFETTLAGVNFEVNSADLTPSAKQVLDKVAESLIAFSSVTVEVQAHTDSMGRKEGNQALSDARAQSVVEYLVKRGVNHDRLIPKGFGEDQPVANNDTAEGRATNRRVVFNVVP
ncbi:MAG: OmpA family protein, partial [Gammaproteobacteria bacterium]|nr:OmpA family protein [Gammaproteobacteria bacterium]